MNATEKLGIGRFETSEELAKELESKNKKEIADRVREISRNQASAQSIELRNKLREELSGKEHREIREALAGTGVERVFDKDMSAEEKAIAEVGAIIPGGEEAAQNIGKMEKWWKSMSESFETAGGLLKEGKFMAAIAVFFKGLFGKFSLDEWNKKPGEENESNGSNENNDTYAGELMKMRAFIEYNYNGEDKGEILNISQKENFKKLTLKEINEINNDDKKIEEWIVKSYGENEKPDKEKVKTLFELFSTNGKANETLKRILGNKYNHDLKISEIIRLIGKDLTIFEHISSLKAEDIMSKSSEIARFDISEFSEGGTPPIIFKERGISKNLGAFILTGAEYKVGNNKEALLSDTRLSKSEKDKLREIMDFGDKIQNEIISNEKINLGMGEKLSDTFSKEPLNLIEITKLYAILGGESDFNKMNEFKQSFIYFSIGGLLDKNRSNWQQGEYIIKLTDLIVEGVQGKTEKIPKGVTEFLGKVGNGLIGQIEKSLKDWGITIAGGLFEACKKYPMLLPTIMLVILMYPYTQRRNIIGAILPKFTK
ncbi:hypothetical protein HUU51_00725 [Candidatus Gracilibacteria bacterium]|nr:hypothetical protein [Candidatus Gracilibacteria bacterium]